MLNPLPHTSEDEEEEEEEEANFGLNHSVHALRKYASADIFLAARTGDICRVRHLLDEEDVDINRRDGWDAVPLYYACLNGHLDVVKLLLERGAICSENTFDGDRCLYGALTNEIRNLLKEADVKKTPPLKPLGKNIRRLCALCDDPEQPTPESLPFQDLSDLELHLGQQIYHVHKIILAARFSRMDEILGRDRDKTLLTLGDLYSTVVWEALLVYAYSEKLEIDVAEVEQLRTLSKHYGCPTLFNAIEKELMSIRYQFKTLQNSSAPKRFVLSPCAFPKVASLEHSLWLFRQRCETLEQAMYWQKDQPIGALYDYADVVIEVGEMCVRAHAAILCSRSEYFYQRLVLNNMHGFQELSQTKCPFYGRLMSTLSLTHVHYKTMRVVLEYIYTNDVESLGDEDLEDLDFISGLLECCDWLLIFEMKQKVGEKLRKREWSLSKIFECTFLADFYSIMCLRDQCLGEIAKLLDEVLASEEEGGEQKYLVESFVVKVVPEEFETADELFDSSARKGDFHGVINSTRVGGIGSNSILEDLREKYLEISGWKREQREQNAQIFDQKFLQFTSHALRKLAQISQHQQKNNFKNNNRL